MDKKGPRSGGFFQLFDWKAKSRKKLFSSKSESPEHDNQGRRSEGNSPMTRLYLMDGDEAGMEYASRGNGGFSCSSSITDEDGLGSRGPSVVARLMGLDSLPTSICPEPYFTPFSDTRSLPDSHRYDRNLDRMMYSGNFRSKMEGPLRQTVEEKTQMQRPVSRPLEKFQTEVLPPKSAKSIPITQHRLLSPIKNPGFIPSRDAAHIMEAAAKIIDARQDPRTKRKTPVLLSSSEKGRICNGKYQEEQPAHVLLRVQDNKEKTDVAQRTSSGLGEVSERSLDPVTSMCLGDRPLNKSWNGLETSSFRSSSDKEEAFSSFRNSGKSVSLAIQAKANVQRRGGMSLSERSIMKQSETGEGTLDESFRKQSRASKNTKKKTPVSNHSVVLRQNNQKQNCAVDKQKPRQEPSHPIQHGRKALSADSSSKPKAVNQPIGGLIVGLRRMEVIGSVNESSLSSAKNNPRKKRSVEADLRNDSARDKNNKSAQLISKPNKPSSWAKDSKKNSMDVVSFTFTAPLARNMPGSDTSGQAQKSANCLGKRAYSQADSIRSPVANNVLAGDALTMLLEQKLRELSNEAGSSCHDALSGQSSSTSASVSQDLTSADTGANSMQKPRHSKEGNSSSPSSNSAYDTSVVPFKLKNKIQDFYGEKHDVRRPSPNSVLEPSFSAESCFPLESMDDSSIRGNRQSLAQADEILVLSFHKKPQAVEIEIESFDSASTLLTRGNVIRKNHILTMNANSVGYNNWEIDYVKTILSNVELMFKDFSLGRSREIINPHLFEQLEGRKGFAKSGSSDCRLRRKALFDCVRECMELRCRKFIGGGCKSWSEGLLMVRKSEWLAEDIYKEILDCISLGDSMVDDLVDKDMRSHYGRWTDFESDAFALGLEVGRDILDSLVVETISTLFS